MYEHHSRTLPPPIPDIEALRARTYRGSAKTARKVLSFHGIVSQRGHTRSDNRVCDHVRRG